MRILFLSAWYPFPADNGSKIRIASLLRSLGQEHIVTLLSFAKSGEPRALERAETGCRSVQTVPWIPYRPDRAGALLGLFAPVPRSLVATYSPEMQARVRAELGREHYDALVTSELGTALYVPGTNGPACISDDVETGQFVDSPHARGPLGRFRRRLTWIKLAGWLKRLDRSVDAWSVVSEPEKVALARTGIDAGRIRIVPNGIDVDACRRIECPPLQDTLVYSGAMTYSANYDAMHFFLEHIYPRILAKRPEVRLLITGETNGVPLERLPQREGVSFTGRLLDARPVVGGSTVCVVPVRKGGGTRIKILEAMALGTPVVATSKGAEGLDVAPGEDVLVADDPAEFAARTLELLGDIELRRRLAAHARALVTRAYDWDRIGVEFRSLVVKTVERRQAWQVSV